MLDNLTNALNISIDLADGRAAAYVVIDTATNNTSSGGVRVAEDISPDEIRALSREMTLKFSFIGLPRGGAKSGVRIPAGTSVEQKREILREFGRRLAPIIQTGIYYPGMDMNCGPDDLRAIYAGAGFPLGAITDTSYFTAISVFNSIEAVRQSIAPDRPLTVAIEGFGSVGAYLAERLSGEHYRIVALSTIRGAVARPEGFNPAELVALRKQHGDDLVSHVAGSRIAMDEVLTAEVDILVPAARILALHEGNMNQVRARYIVPAANAPYTDGAIEAFHGRGVVCLPGFVTNSGGVFASGLRDSGIGVEQIEAIGTGQYRAAVAALLSRSAELGRSPVRLAETVAMARLAAARQGGGEPRSLKVMKKLRRRGLVPGRVYATAVAARFIENLVNLERLIRTHA